MRSKSVFLKWFGLPTGGLSQLAQDTKQVETTPQNVFKVTPAK